MKQQDLSESTGRNVAERIKAIKEGGDGYMTVLTSEETKSFLTCSNFQKGKCIKNLPDTEMGCGRDSICGFKDFYHAE